MCTTNYFFKNEMDIKKRSQATTKFIMISKSIQALLATDQLVVHNNHMMI
jgi:hypothetical protein